MAQLRIFALAIFALLSLGIFLPSAYACGCGIAISDMKVFNALKETQAYLLIDVKDNQTYSEMPFFRFVSMDEPYNVTIVFPMDQIPAGVEGKKISAGEFLSDYKVNLAEDYIITQDGRRLMKNIAESAYQLSNGIFPHVMTTMSAINMDNSAEVGALAHFEFEGGSLDIYNVSSMQSLEEFAKEATVNLTGEVKDLVEKYKNYYVAVLYLKVPSVVSEEELKELKSCMPEGLERIKVRLANSSNLSYHDVDKMIYEESRNSSCGDRIFDTVDKYVSSATYANDRVNGTLVIMSFNSSNNFFYPTSVVNSYKYPVTDQKYYVKVPDNLHIQLSSSEVSKTVNFGGERWYKIESTKDDLKGEIVEAGLSEKLQDMGRNVIDAMHYNVGGIGLVLIVAFLTIPVIFFRHIEKIGPLQMAAMVGTFVLGGFLLSAIAMFFMKRVKTALLLAAFWVILFVGSYLL